MVQKHEGIKTLLVWSEVGSSGLVSKENVSTIRFVVEGEKVQDAQCWPVLNGQFHDGIEIKMAVDHLQGKDSMKLPVSYICRLNPMKADQAAAFFVYLQNASPAFKQRARAIQVGNRFHLSFILKSTSHSGARQSAIISALDCVLHLT